MAYEPFSLSTRKTKSTLLVFSVLSFAIAFYDVSLKNVPGVGFEIPVPDGALNFVVGIAVAYLTIAFMLYCYDDITYMSRPENFQKLSQELIDENTQLTEEMKELDKKLSRTTSSGSNQSIGYSEGSSTSHSSGTSTNSSSGFSGESEPTRQSHTITRSEGVSETSMRSERLQKLEELKRQADVNNEKLQSISITRATWLRIYVFDTTIPIVVGVTSNILIWYPFLQKLF